MDAIENFGSYGAGEDRLELLDRDEAEEPEGFLTAEEACAAHGGALGGHAARRREGGEP